MKAFKGTGSIFDRGRISGSFRPAWSTRKELVPRKVSKATEKPCLVKQNTKPNKKINKMRERERERERGRERERERERENVNLQIGTKRKKNRMSPRRQPGL